MNTKKYRWLLYTITLTIIATITVQVYWNYKNYQQNKQRVVNEIQISLDNALDEYFAELAKSNFLPMINSNLDSLHFSNTHGKTKRRIVSWNSSGAKKNDSIFENIEIKVDAKKFDTLTVQSELIGSLKKLNIPSQINDVRLIQKFNDSDSLQILNNLKTVYISISNSDLEYEKLDSLLKKQLKKKNLQIDYSLNHFKGDSLFFHSNNNKIVFDWGSKNKEDSIAFKTNFKNVKFNLRDVSAKSTYLKNNEQFKLLFKDSSYEALKRSSTGILLSLLLSIAIISCLFYLLKIINKQKQLAEIKNDLISNITHEFKTPITTVSTAIEAIEMFNGLDDKEKTKKYVSISNEQLKKLHQMVEKLLETATLDSETLMLKKEKTDLIKLVKKASSKDEFLTSEKSIHFNTSKDEFQIDIDPFHFENAISNLIDNAIKYGGNTIEVHINFVLNNVEISIADNGNDIEKSQRDKIFDKFYRIPKGNTHNVKGFGIGLYYTKKIVEKHDGKIHLVPNSTNTIFKITLPI